MEDKEKDCQDSPRYKASLLSSQHPQQMDMSFSSLFSNYKIESST